MRHCFNTIFLFLLTCCLGFAEDTAEYLECLPLSILHYKSEDIEKMDIALSAECEPLTTVGGCINVISGHFFQADQDLIGNTIDPLRLTRYYDSANCMETFLGTGFGSQYPLLASKSQNGTRHNYVLISERDGFLIPYRCKLDDHHYRIDPRLLEKGYTNLSRVGISGHANFVNWQALWQLNGWGLQLGDGTKRFYTKLIELERIEKMKLKLPSKKVYLLTKEEKPNGNKVNFDYDDEHRLSKIWTTNRDGKTINKINVQYTSEGCEIKSSCGTRVDYSQEMINYPHSSGPFQTKILKTVHSSQKGNVDYQYPSDHHRASCVEKVFKPNGRCIEVHYNKKGQVERLSEPLGPKGKMIDTYSFQYEKEYTRVLNVLNQLSIYRFDSKQRLERIDTHDGLSLVRQEVFDWSKVDGQEGWLKSKSIQLAGEIYYLKTYTYDHNGNIKRQSLYGNLTGKKHHQFTLSKKREMDRYSVEYDYSQDEYNLLIRKTTPEGLVITYDYLSGTNLCTKELHSYQGKIQERFFWEYDSNGQVNRSIEDDGSSKKIDDLIDVTYRRVKTIEAEQDFNLPSFGKPKGMAESYLDNGQLILLKRIEFFYDEQGNENGQKVYDSQGNFCYEISKTYDQRQRLIRESNALNDVKTYAYDDNNNKKEEVHLGGKTIHYHYDLGNRLRVKEETHQSGKKFVTNYKYNALNQLKAEIDPYKQKTFYKYDRLGRQKQCIKPINEEGINPTITKECNLLDQVISEKDENGFITKYSYNTYGKPTQIVYPDGSNERCIYFPCGWLKQKWNADGTSIEYAYDPKGRILKETTKDLKGILIKEEEWTYKGPLLQTKKDAMGLVTSYHYDKAGRKIGEICGYKVINYQYDDFGRVIKISRALNDREAHCELYEYDWLDRKTAKTLQDSQRNIYAKETYEYDLYNNPIKKSVWQTEDTIATTRFHYDSDNSLIWQEDPFGNRTTYHYNHNHINGLGQQVQCRSTQDPLGRPCHEADNIYHQLVRKDVLEGAHIVACTHYSYDLAGHLIKEQAMVMDNGQRIREYIVLRTYDNRGFLKTEKEMPSGKTTDYTYEKGRLSKKNKPDGVSIHYEYDALGRLEKMHSSDKTINYIYHYDLHDNICQIEDAIHQTTQERTFDLGNRLIREIISPGIAITYDYDNLDRLIKMALPHGSYITYTYGAYHLTKIQRYDAANHLKYTYECPAYDLQGNLLKGISPASQIHYAYDLLGRAIKIDHPKWKAFLEKFDPIGNLKEMTQKDPSGEVKGKFCYDRFDHLSSESSHEENRFSYDSLGNCLKKNENERDINDLNQVSSDGVSMYTYGLNGNLETQAVPSVEYSYDALNRMSSCKKGKEVTSFIYDSFGRCLEIIDPSGTKHLLYHGEREIGSMKDGRIQELRLLHPKANQEMTFALELNGEVFFPVQDYCYNICALQKSDGTLAQWYRYSAFGTKTLYGDESFWNPWGFANRREVEGLLLFAHRFYNPTLMRWQTTDPLRFKDGLNLYHYVHNNPFLYKDSDGRFAMAIPFVEVAFGETLVVSCAALGPYAVPALFAVAAAYGTYQLCTYIDSRCNQVQTEPRENTQDKRNTNADQDPRANGDPHTVIEQAGPGGKYTTFNEDGTFKQYRGSGKPHGNIPRPNIKENELNETPNGPKPGKPTIRPAKPDEIPRISII